MSISDSLYFAWHSWTRKRRVGRMRKKWNREENKDRERVTRKAQTGKNKPEINQQKSGSGETPKTSSLVGQIPQELLSWLHKCSAIIFPLHPMTYHHPFICPSIPLYGHNAWVKCSDIKGITRNLKGEEESRKTGDVKEDKKWYSMDNSYSMAWLKLLVDLMQRTGLVGPARRQLP